MSARSFKYDNFDVPPPPAPDKRFQMENHVEPKRADHQFWRRFNKAQDNNNLTDIQKRIQNMLDNPDGQFKKAVQQGQIKESQIRKKIFDAAPEDGDTTPSDNNSDGRPDNRKEEVPKYTTHVEPKRPVVQLRNLVKKAQDKGIIQIAVLAVAVAGTVGAFVWGKK